MKITILLFLFHFAYVSPHNITRLIVPEKIDPRGTAELECGYRMGGEALHSVKWYQGEMEIFRFSPGEEPTSRTFNGTGLSLISGSCSRDVCRLKLEFQRGVYSRHKYKCEVSTERPRFAVVSKSQDMIVAVLPEKEPVITGVPTSMYPNQEVILNCSSSKSLPETQLKWYIDDVPEKYDPSRWPPSRTTEYSSPDRDGLRESWRLLTLRAKSHGVNAHRVKCEATIAVDPTYLKETHAKIQINTRAHISKYIAAGTVNRANLPMIITIQTIIIALYNVKKQTSSVLI